MSEEPTASYFWAEDTSGWSAERWKQACAELAEHYNALATRWENEHEEKERLERALDLVKPWFLLAERDVKGLAGHMEPEVAAKYMQRFTPVREALDALASPEGAADE